MRHLKQTFVCLRQGVHLIWNSEAKRVKQQKKMWTRGGEGHHPCPSSDPCSAYLPISFTFFPHCGPWTQTIKFSMPLIFFPKESQTEVLSCSWLVSKSEQKWGVRWGNSEVSFILYPGQNWVNSPGGGGTPIHDLYGYVPPKGVVILKLLI